MEIKMIPEYESNIHVRIPIKQREQIETLIKIGRFKNLSQVVREALKQFLEKQLGDAGP
jgi:Arc/MetJ-type ribon-helix-helix transcriptional regulator